MPPRKTPADYHALATDHGFRWLGPEVSSVHTKTGWECEEGHRWKTAYACVQQGTACPACAVDRRAEKRRKKPADFCALAKQHGFDWLGPQVPSVSTKTAWECQEGHTWEARYNDIQQGHGCPVCAVRRQAEKCRKQPADYHILADERGFRWIGPEVDTTQTNTTWECQQGHRWEARYNSIQQGAGCPVCAGKVPKTPADYHALARDRGFCWLGPEVSTVLAITAWECQEGHTWEARYNDIQQGRGCPKCAVRKRAEEHRRKPTDYEALAKERGFQWLGPLVPSIRTKTRWKCEEEHEWSARYSDISRGVGCPHCAGNIPKTPADYHALAEKSGLFWLGPEIANIKDKTTWQCQQGHSPWEARYNDIQQGHGCPNCAIDRRVEQWRKKSADYEAVARERGFLWLGPEALTVLARTNWKCQEGHEWPARYSDISRGVGCPHCAGKIPKTPADYHLLARERGFQWLGPEVSDTSIATRWACRERHEWKTSYSNIRMGTGCPSCIDMVAGARVSQIQRRLCDMLGGGLNQPCGKYRIDVALEYGGLALAMEYDSWYWHGGHGQYDAKRDQHLRDAGWRVLRIRSNSLLPTEEQLYAALDRLLADEVWVEIVLEDWGKGPTSVFVK